MTAQDFDAPPFPADPQALYELALRGRTRRSSALKPLAEHMARMAGNDTAAQARAGVVLAWAQSALGDREQAQATAQRVQGLVQHSADRAVQALGHDLLAQLAHTAGDYEQAIAQGMAAMACPEAARQPQEWSVTMSRLGTSHHRAGRPDEALRWHYRSLLFAAASGDPVAHAAAVGGAGSAQLSLLNLEEAAALCGQAWSLVRDTGPGLIWGTCATNWAMVLMLQQRYQEALPLADTILAADGALGSGNRYLRFVLLGELMAHAGRSDQAQALLDQGLALYPFGPEPPLNWVRGQMVLWNAAGRHAQALALFQSAMTSQRLATLSHTDDDYDLMSLHTEAAVAHEALGDLAQALREQRASLRVERRMGVAAMQARRLTVQVQSEVDAARRERDSALQRESAAALEKQRLSLLNTRLEEVSLAKSRFLAAASHDLRQPLHALGLQLAHLRSGLDGPARDAVEQRMERALGSLTHMFDTLLDLSRMDAGVLTPRIQRLALAPMLVRLVDELAPVAQAAGLRLALHMVGERFTDTDAALLETMLRNLLANALKYTPHGGVLLALRDRGGSLNLEVWDSGVGIAHSERERVFQEFYQVDPAGPDHHHHHHHHHHRHGLGLGLGLSIVRRLSTLLGHPVHIDSRPGIGTRFRVSVPWVAAPSTAATKPTVPEAGAAAVPATACLCVAVIEDDAEVRDSLAALLVRWGYRVQAGACAADVVGTPGSDLRPDLVIADFSLAAGATGDVEVARIRQTLAWPVPALIISGGTGVEHLRALAACGLPWLSKPVQPARLRAWLLGCTRAPGSGARQV